MSVNYLRRYKRSKMLKNMENDIAISNILQL